MTVMAVVRAAFAGMMLCAWAGQTAGAETPAAALARLADSYWQGRLRAHPTEATSLGDHRFDDLLPDITPAGRKRDHDRLDKLQEQVEAIDPAALNAADRITRSMLVEVIEDDLADLDCGFHDWVVDPLDGPQIAFQNLPSMQLVTTPAQAHAMVQRWRRMGSYVDAHIANLRGGLAQDRIATRSQVDRVLEQLDELLAKDVAQWALLAPLATAHPDWSQSDREHFDADLRQAVQKQIRPAFVRYRDFLRAEVLPKARPDDRVGLSNLRGGEGCYEHMIRRHTSLDLSPRAIHNIGQVEVERTLSEMRTLGARVFGTDSLPEILKRLRSDPALYFRTRDEVEAKAREALARAQAAVPQDFGIRPQARCEVVRMEAHEEKHSTIAYYREPAMDGSRPGQYWINTSEPETRPRYEAEALAFHESVPGHHLQTAIAQELHGLPEFRKHASCTAYVEGWGLYSEQLADEMGLYSGDLDRIGKLSFQAWRSCRLVVDTGMHALGWSRQQAIDYMLSHSALAENNIVNEVDRYISWPGQALAYKLGQLEILKLRNEVRAMQGDRFNLSEFHDVVLGNGPVSLTVLRDIVHAHYAGSTE
jgi:uncharacterized protein (DUF885 family)